MADNKVGGEPVAPTTPAGGTAPTDDQNKGNGTPSSAIDPVEYGKLKAERDSFKEQLDKATPLVQAVYADPEAYAATERSYQKNILKINVDDKDNKDDKKPAASADGKSDTPATPPAPSATEVDNRNALIGQAVSGFEKTHGIDKLKDEEKKTLNVAIIGELRGILDPMDTGKDVGKLMEGVSVTKLPGILEKAYLLATRNDREAAIAKKAVEQYSSSETGMIGSVGGDTGLAPSAENMTLTESERKIARRLGVTEEDYLKNKVELAKNGGKLY